MPTCCPAWERTSGLPGAADASDCRTLHRYLVVLVDGLGWHLLNGRATLAPFLVRLPMRGRSRPGFEHHRHLGEQHRHGLPPGSHGIAGYFFRFPGGLLNTLRWPADLSGLDVQPQFTYFERLTKAGVYCCTVTPSRFRGSGLTTCALRGADFLGYPDDARLARRVELAVAASATSQRSLVYVYDRNLDHAGHRTGIGIGEWRPNSCGCDRLAAALRAALPNDVRLIVTGDHGMVDVPGDQRVTIEHHRDLTADVRLIGGEGRLRQLYVRPSTESAVRGALAGAAGDDAWVLTRDEAIEAGWFGPVHPRLADRFGDVLVAMAGHGCADDADPAQRVRPGGHARVPDRRRNDRSAADR